jgi:hypothetical protein
LAYFFSFSQANPDPKCTHTDNDASFKKAANEHCLVKRSAEEALEIACKTQNSKSHPNY